MHTNDIRKTNLQPIVPSIQFDLDPAYSGTILVAGDLNNDGRLDFISARNNEQSITCLIAYNLEGKVLWTWGTPNVGQQIMTYDLPLQIYDINADGQNEVIFSIENWLIILNGQTGQEINRHPLPTALKVVDCITFGYFQGQQRGVQSPDIIIKSRYQQIWVFTADWKLLWSYESKRGWKTCHHPTLMDLDGDGKDEIFVGFEMLDHDGTILWSIPSFYLKWKQLQGRGHLDSVRVLQSGSRMQDWRIALTYCSANFLAVLDGTGKILWNKKGLHFEALDVGHFSDKSPSPQLFVDIDHLPFGMGQCHFYDINGSLFTQISVDYARQHRCVDWNGDGLDEVVLASALAIVDGTGNRIASLHFHGPESQNHGYKESEANHELIYVSILDISGSHKGDIVLHSKDSVCIYLNEKGKPNPNQRWDTHNLTFY